MNFKKCQKCGMSFPNRFVKRIPATVRKGNQTKRVFVEICETCLKKEQEKGINKSKAVAWKCPQCGKKTDGQNKLCQTCFDGIMKNEKN